MASQENDPRKALDRITRFMGEQTERETVVAWLRAVGDRKQHGTDWRTYYEIADAIEVGAHEGTPIDPVSA